MKKQVSIIGGSGFIGSYITRRFLDVGYEVKIAVTDQSKKDKFQHILDMGPVEVVECDVREYDSVIRFLEGTHNLVHTGTPFFLGAEVEQEEMIIPTVNGTKNVIKACQSAPDLQKLIIIASIVAINGHIPMMFYDPVKGEDHVFTEGDSTVSLKSHDPYCRAKYQADQLVRKFVNENPQLSFEIVSLYPGFVIGPPLSDRPDCTSSHLLYAFKNKMIENPSIKPFFDQDTEFAMVAVKDVAEATYKSVVTPNLHREKFFISNETWRVSDIHRMLNGENPRGKKWVMYSNNKAIKELGLQFRPAFEPLTEYLEMATV